MSENRDGQEKRVSRWACLPVIIIWIVLFTLPIIGCRLINNGQVQWSVPGGSQVRLFLLQDSDLEGIGVQRTRTRGPGGSCLETSVNYFMWVGESDNSVMCQCAPETTDPPNGCTLP